MPPKTASNKRKSARGTKKNPWVDEAFVMTSEKSPLVDIDLAKLFAKPEAWTCLDEEEKKEILSLLPESVHPDAEPSTENPDGIIPPLPGEFLRSTVWRDATRQFQLDLANGKYDPQWQKQAHKAVKERAEGKFDAKKERDFEAFWGQKQRYHTNVPAGDSATVDFKTLVTNDLATDPNQFSARYESCVDNKAIVETSIHQNRSGVNTAMDIDPSDDVSPCVESKAAKDIYGHTHMRFLGKPFIDELLDDSDDCSIMSDPPDMIDEIDDADFHRSLQELGPLPPSNTPYVPFNLKADPSDSRKVTSSTGPEVAVVGVLPTGHTDATNGTRPEQSNLLMPKDDTCESPTLMKTAIATETESQVSEVSLQAHTSQSNGQESIRPKVDIDDNTQTETRAPDIWPETSNQPNLGSPGTLSTKPAATLEVPDKTSLPSEGKEAPVPESPNSVEPVIFPGVTGPMSLIRKIHELDGRESSARVANAWMLFRCIRNNQDMGTLWEVRHSWYTRSKR
ncbi:hypothetical protein TEQG_06596 [Trichophyton equinum CBS 127.97]|uniref:DEUBAD domain-containing protein n=1 Tax=Trichophyton equinum (strain ATCC MYA-4606 / CBS 127.97) TaxID=559882 RepID=F2Q001_TRIEC|nr:hypothetical protein TEQG_06596 [Trichophyton equinum CBS 127.97]